MNKLQKRQYYFQCIGPVDFEKIFEENAGLEGQYCSPSHAGTVDPEVDHNLTRTILMPRTKFDSNRTDSSGEEEVLVSYVKIGGRQNRGRLSPLTGGVNRHAEHNLTTRRAQEAPILFQLHSAR